MDKNAKTPPAKQTLSKPAQATPASPATNPHPDLSNPIPVTLVNAPSPPSPAIGDAPRFNAPNHGYHNQTPDGETLAQADGLEHRAVKMTRTDADANGQRDVTVSEAMVADYEAKGWKRTQNTGANTVLLTRAKADDSGLTEVSVGADEVVAYERKGWKRK